MAGKGRPGALDTYRVTLGYDGAQFHGYARQPTGPTVEGALLDALAQLLEGRPAALAVGGRTDRGVHAVGQVVSFRIPRPCEARVVAGALSGAHRGLWVEEVRVVPRWFHARRSARARRYAYLAPDDGAVDIHRLRRQLAALSGRRCFHAFARDTPAGQDTRRRLHTATARRAFLDDAPRIRFDLVADSFLRRMVRVLVATALTTARAGLPDDALVRIARTRDRRQTARPAPPENLYLVAVAYDPEPIRHSIRR